MTQSITINKETILSEIRNITARYGKFAKMMDMAVTEDESSSIDVLYNKNINKIMGEISRFQPTYSNNVITVQEPANFNTGIVPALTSSLSDLILNLVVSDWLLITKNDPKQFQEAAANCLGNVKLFLNSRTK